VKKAGSVGPKESFTLRATQIVCVSARGVNGSSRPEGFVERAPAYNIVPIGFDIN